MALSTSLKVGRTATGYCVRIEGRGTMNESPAVQALALEVLSSPEATFNLDLSNCDYLDSTFLGCLAGLGKRFGSAGPPRLTIVQPPPACRKLLASARIESLLTFVPAPPGLVAEGLAIPTEGLTSDELGRHVRDCHQRLVELGGANAAVFKAVVEQLDRDLARRSAEHAP